MASKNWTTSKDWYTISKTLGLAYGPTTDRTRIAQQVKALQRGLTGAREKIATPYMDASSSFQAYLLYYWAISYFEVCASFQS